MKIVGIQEKTFPIASPMRNAVIDFSGMTLSVVAMVTDVIRNGRAVVGYGFNSNGRYGQGGLLRDRFIPRLLMAEPPTLLDDSGTNFDASRAWAAMMSNEKPGGHGERSVAVGVLDMALWDVIGKIAEKPLFQVLAEKYGTGKADRRVFVYAAGGYYYPDGNLHQLRREMASYLDRGYSVVKMKIGGASLSEDLRRVECVLQLLGKDQHLAVDANGRFDLPLSLAYARALAQFSLFWYEEPGDPLDYALLSEVASEYDRPLATGENLFSTQDARNLIRYGGLRQQADWLQFDCALSYGLVEYQRTLKMLGEAGWAANRCIPHGGHQLSLNLAAGLGLGGNESYPDLFLPFGGFPDGVEVTGGYVTLPELPGIGFEGKADLYEVLRPVGLGG